MACHPLPLLILLGLLLAAPPSSYAAKPAACNPADKLALLRFKNYLGNPYTLTTWVNDTDCCRNWYCTECDPHTGRVTAIVISYMELSKPTPIPPSVGHLPFLEKLILRKSPNITGPFPQELSKLTKLRMLWMDWNSLTGPLPAFLSKLTKLTYINLSFNKISGPIPPSIGDIPALDALFLDRNQLTGTIPEELGRKHLAPYFRLSHNNLTGPIPKSFSKMNITQLDLSRNQLTGDASVLFPTSGTWTSFNLSRNLFEFDISKAALLTDAYSLDFSHNRIYGKLPQKLDQLENLSFLDVSYNRLCGQIPQGGFLANRTEGAFIHNKCLCGSPLPNCK